MKKSILIRVGLLMAWKVRAFTPTNVGRTRQWHSVRKPTICFSHEDDSPQSQEEASKDKHRLKRRAGGRVRPRRKHELDRPKEKPLAIPEWVQTVAIPLFALWLFVRLLFGGGFATSDTYYYQSSVYESRVYGPDGRVDTSRKESVRSNIPGLVDGQRKGELPRRYDRQLDFQRRADKEFDRVLDREIDSMMRIEKSFMNDFW